MQRRHSARLFPYHNTPFPPKSSSRNARGISALKVKICKIHNHLYTSKRRLFEEERGWVTLNYVTKRAAFARCDREYIDKVAARRAEFARCRDFFFRTRAVEVAALFFFFCCLNTAKETEYVVSSSERTCAGNAARLCHYSM